jgi:hypothetical protein
MSHQPTLRPKPAKELAYSNTRQTEDMQQKLKRNNENNEQRNANKLGIKAQLSPEKRQ